MRLAQDYTEARGRFLDAARAAGARVEHHDHPLTGPGGEALATDVAIDRCARRADPAARDLGDARGRGLRRLAVPDRVARRGCVGPRRPRGRARPRDQPVRVRVDPAGERGQRRPEPQLHRLRRDAPGEPGLRPARRRARAADVGRGDPDRDREHAARVRGRARLRRAAGRGVARSVPAPDRDLLRRRRGRCGRSARSRRSRASTLDRRGSGPAIIDLHTGLGPFGVGELIASHPDGAGGTGSTPGSATTRVPERGDVGVGRRERRRPRRARRVGRRARRSPASRSSGGPSTSSRCRTRCGPTRGCTRTRIHAGRRPARSRPRCAPRSRRTIRTGPTWCGSASPK